MPDITCMSSIYANFELSTIALLHVESVGAARAVVAGIVFVVDAAQVGRASPQSDLHKRGEQKEQQSAGIGEQSSVK